MGVSRSRSWTPRATADNLERRVGFHSFIDLLAARKPQEPMPRESTWTKFATYGGHA